jgi:hypothetical protein
MKGNCPPIERFEQLLLGDPEDPGRRHLDQCPRCRARVASFAMFMQLDPLPEGARLEDVRERLSRAIHREAEAVPQRARWSNSPFSWFRIQARVWRPALGVACIVLVVGIFLYRESDRRSEPAPVLRDTSSTAPIGAPLVSESLPDGGMLLRWTGVPDAQGYRIHVYGSNLLEITSFDIGSQPTAMLSADRLAALGPSRAPRIWRVGVLRNGDEIALTPPATFRLP